LRQFCRLYLEAAPDDTTLIRWANTIGAQTVAALNDRVVESARSLKVTRGRKLRTDDTVVETNVHHPTDDSLLADGVRVICRLVKRAKGYVEESIQKEHKGELFRDRARSAKRLAHKIGRMARRRKEEAQASYRAAYQRLVEVAKASIRQAGRVRTLLEKVCPQHPRSQKSSPTLRSFSSEPFRRPAVECSRGSRFRPKKNWFPSSRNIRA
jgi:IS5 family transposase